MFGRANKWMTEQDRWQLSWIPVTESGCYLWVAHTDKDGYGEFRVAGKNKKAHRYSWEISHGKIPGGISVLHRCDVRSCVNATHLFLGTQSDNMRDMTSKGRRARGSNLSAKISENDVLKIRSDKRKLCEIAADYGVAFQTISNIKLRKRWCHVA